MQVKVEMTKSEGFKQYYAVGAIGGHSPYDFRIAFYNDSAKVVEDEVQVIERRIDNEIILSPLAAKELSAWLQSHVQEYEKAFGAIKGPSQQGTGNKDAASTQHIQGYL